MSTLLLLGLLFSHVLTAQSRVDSNVVYGMHSGLALLMDVHKPAQSNGFGVVVIPGSGWHAPLTYDARPLNPEIRRKARPTQ